MHACMIHSFSELDHSEKRNDWTEQSDESSSHKGGCEGVHGSVFARGQAGGKASTDANDDCQGKQLHWLNI